MGRTGIDAEAAFEMLREHSQRYGLKLVDVAASMVDSHMLLPPLPPELPADAEPH
jgi:AmiR/NasT family two-component response regulator